MTLAFIQYNFNEDTNPSTKRHTPLHVMMLVTVGSKCLTGQGEDEEKPRQHLW